MEQGMHPLIEVVAYDPRWPEAFTWAREELAAAWGPNVVVIHHIGSTSIAGLYAKPVIDILAVVGDLLALDQQSGRMEQLGYQVMGEFGILGRRYFRRDDAEGKRTHQVHAFANDSPHVKRHLAFRDFLRAHTAVAHEYAALKRALAATHPHDMEAYMDGKDRFIKEVERRALEWANR